MAPNRYEISPLVENWRELATTIFREPDQGKRCALFDAIPKRSRGWIAGVVTLLDQGKDPHGLTS